jgi:hypothetical protein
LLEKKTNKGKKQMNDLEKKQLQKNDLVNDLDRIFYDIENIEDQATVFRLILRQFNISKLTVLKDFIKHDLKTFVELREGK